MRNNAGGGKQRQLYLIHREEQSIAWGFPSYGSSEAACQPKRTFCFEQML